MPHARLAGHVGTVTNGVQKNLDPPWDAVRTDAIPLLQYVTGLPVGPDGTALATVADFRTWMREHDHPGKAPWTEPLRRPGTGGESASAPASE